MLLPGSDSQQRAPSAPGPAVFGRGGLPPVRQGPSPQEIAQTRQFKRNFDLVEEARRAWQARYEARKRRRRNRDFFAGEQWEFVRDDEGNLVSEEERMREQGRVPWVMNEIKPIVQNMRGQFRQGYADPLAVARAREQQAAEEQMSVALEVTHDINDVAEVDADEFLECLLSGAFGWKVHAEYDDVQGRDEVAIDPINQNRIFYNPDLDDRRMKGVRLIGEIHDWTLDEIIQQFANDRADEQQLRALYDDIGPASGVEAFAGTSYDGFDLEDRLDWYWPAESDKARVVEVWKKEYAWKRYVHDPLDGSYEAIPEEELSDEEITRINEERKLIAHNKGLPSVPLIDADKEYEGVWIVRFLTPDGYVLWEGETPYWHDEHPYVMGFPTMIDGEYWGMIEDLIDPQRLLNRMTASIDYMFGIGAKGMLMVPEDAIPEDMSIDDFADEWTRMGGVIKFKPSKHKQLPQQITTDTIPSGIFEWLGSQRQWLEKISGVNSAVQGQDPGREITASQYAAQIEQGQVANLDFFECFYNVRRKRDRKALQVVMQYFDERELHGPKSQKAVSFDPATVRGIVYDIVIQDVRDTATTRQLWEQDLKEYLQEGRITFDQFLQMSAHPKSDAVRKVIQQTNPVLLGQPVLPELVEAAKTEDPDALALLQQAQEFPPSGGGGGASMQPSQQQPSQQPTAAAP